MDADLSFQMRVYFVQNKKKILNLRYFIEIPHEIRRKVKSQKPCRVRGHRALETLTSFLYLYNFLLYLNNVKWGFFFLSIIIWIYLVYGMILGEKCIKHFYPFRLSPMKFGIYILY